MHQRVSFNVVRLPEFVFIYLNDLTSIIAVKWVINQMTKKANDQLLK